MLWALVSCIIVLNLSVHSPLSPAQAIESPPAKISPSPSAPTLLKTGIEQFQAEAFTEAIASWQKALNAYTLLDDRLHQALVLSNLSLAYQHLGQWQEAEATLNQSLNFFNQQTPESRSVVDWEYYAKALNAQGWLAWRQGQSEEALQAWKQAALAYKSANYFPGIIGSQINQAQALQSLGLSIAAQKILKQVQSTTQQQTDPKLQAIALQSLGNAFRRVGNLEESQKVLKQSFAIANQELTPSSSPNPQNSIQSSILLDLGNTERAQWERAVALNLDEADEHKTAALDYYQKAATLAPSTLPLVQANANLLSLLVTIKSVEKSAMSQWDDIRKLWNSLYAQFAELPLSRSGIEVQLNAVNSLLKLQRMGESPDRQRAEIWSNLAQLLTRTIQQARQLQDPRAESLSLGQLGHLYEQARQWNDAKTVTNQAILLAEAIQAPDILYLWQWQLGRILHHQKTRDDAICFHQEEQKNGGEQKLVVLYRDEVLCTYEQAVTSLEKVRQDLSFIDSDVQFSFRDNVEPLYRQYVDLLLQSPNLNDDTLRQATKLIDALQLAELENYLGCNIDPVQISQQVIDPNAAILYPIILDQRLAVILQLPNQSFQLHTVQRPKADMEALITRLYENFPVHRNWHSVQQDMSQLYDLLIRPFESILNVDSAGSDSPIKTLVFVLDGGLRNIPMSAMWDSQRQQYLLERYAIAVAPSLQLIEPKPLTHPPKILTAGSTEALAHPFQESNLSPLKNVQKELNAIQSLPTKVKVLFNETFTKANLERQLQDDDFSILHLASHGVFSSDLSRTFIALSDHPLFAEDLDNLLRSSDIEGSIIELLVLSACQTATGDNRATLGLAGLTVRAGARSTLATLWTVDDASAATVMAEFYRQLVQNPDSSRAEALRRAQINLWKAGAERLKNWDFPYYWSPYILVGNWL
jgi:CHAT domain-containing protein